MRPTHGVPLGASNGARDSDAPERRHTVVTLRHPLQLGSQVTERLYVKVPRAAEFGLLPAPTPGSRLFTADYHPFAAKLCGISLAEFDLLEAEDYAAVMEAAQAFAAEIPPTGASASLSSRERSISGEPTS